MDLQIAYDSSADSAPSGFKTAMSAVVAQLDALILDPITVTISVAWGNFRGEPIHDFSEGGGSGIGIDYGTLTDALRAQATSAADLAAVASLPQADPTDGGHFLVYGSQQKALGMTPSSQFDGEVGFGDQIPFDFSTNGTTAPGLVDFMGMAEHELTHAMGRSPGLQFAPGWYAPLDLFRYAAPGELELTEGQPAYFSIDGGATRLADFSTTDDPGDWADTAGLDSFRAVVIDGTHNPITAVDRTVMDVLGYTVACFAEGTRIATPEGEATVESLAPGRAVRLAGGGAAPVVWLGHRRVDCRRHPRPWDVWPVRVQADAFGPGRPARELWLSPDHAVAAQGVLIPVRYLLNGATVAQVPRDHVTYWHVELPRHALLLAEGLAAESFLDTGNRAAFGGRVTQLHPDFARAVWQAQGCLTLRTGGAEVAAARRDLLARAAALGHGVSRAPALRLDGAAAERSGDVWRWRLPAGARSVTLRSRAWTPAHMDADSEDTRRLGVAVGALWLDGAPVALDDPRLEGGWHAPEGDWRWTDGAARVRTDGAATLAARLAMTGRYWRADGRARTLSRAG